MTPGTTPTTDLTQPGPDISTISQVSSHESSHCVPVPHTSVSSVIGGSLQSRHVVSRVGVQAWLAVSLSGTGCTWAGPSSQMSVSESLQCFAFLPAIADTGETALMCLPVRERDAIHSTVAQSLAFRMVSPGQP